MADGFSHRNVTLGIELYFDDVERAAAYHSRPGRAGGWPTVVTPPGLGLGADVEADCEAGGSAARLWRCQRPRSRPCRCGYKAMTFAGPSGLTITR
jgi:hypothetical protein